MRSLTEKQENVLEFIERHISTHSYPPTIREIAEGFSISVKGAYDHVKALERKGYLKLGENRSRTIEILKPINTQAKMIDIPLLGTVAAGRPILAEENRSGFVQVPYDMAKPSGCFALTVRGDSMRDAGILNGDIAIVEQRPTAENGEIVVAMIDESVTLKRFYKETGRMKLVAENPAYSPIYTRDAKIIGALKGIIRRY